MSYLARKPLSILLSLALLVCCVAVKSAPASHSGARQKEAQEDTGSPRRRALLVAINTYKPLTGAESKTIAPVRRVAYTVQVVNRGAYCNDYTISTN